MHGKIASRRLSGSVVLLTLTCDFDTVLGAAFRRSGRGCVSTDGARGRGTVCLAAGLFAVLGAVAALVLESLGHWGALAEPLSVLPEDEDGNAEEDGDAGKDEAGNGELPLCAWEDVGVERCSVDRGDTGEEVTTEAVATSSTRGVGTVGGDHVVDRSHVDCVVGDADHGGEYHGGDPVDVGRAEGSPGETEEADGFEGHEPDEGFQAAFRADAVNAAGLLHGARVVAVEGEEEEVGYYVADQETVVVDVVSKMFDRSERHDGLLAVEMRREE